MTRLDPHPCLTVDLAEPLGDELIDRLWDLGAVAVEQRDGATMSRAPAGRALIVAGFADRSARDLALAAIAGVDAGVEAASMDVVDDGWSVAWRAHFSPVELRRIRIAAPWMDLESAGRETVVVDPGPAFGTGGHATTRLVLEMLEDMAEERRLPEILDVGTGSGVLAMAAVALGSPRALGIDTDADAVESARANAKANGMSDRVELVLGAPADLSGEWDLIAANMDLGAFRAHGDAIARLASPGGVILVSGLLEEQEEGLRDLLSGCSLERTARRDGWIAAALGRRG